MKRETNMLFIRNLVSLFEKLIWYKFSSSGTNISDLGLVTTIMLDFCVLKAYEHHWF